MAITWGSHFVLGNDNWAEQLGEWIYFKITGNVIDVTVE